MKTTSRLIGTGVGGVRGSGEGRVWWRNQAYICSADWEIVYQIWKYLSQTFIVLVRKIFRTILKKSSPSQKKKGSSLQDKVIDLSTLKL